MRDQDPPLEGDIEEHTLGHALAPLIEVGDGGGPPDRDLLGHLRGVTAPTSHHIKIIKDVHALLV